MGWDSARPVPWRRLIREWLIYVAIMGVVFAIFFRDRGLLGVFAGLLASGPIYLVLGGVLAKFGYQRKTFGQTRREALQRRADTAVNNTTGPSTGGARRPRPAPTKRTGGGSSRPTGRRR